LDLELVAHATADDFVFLRYRPIVADGRAQ
jgi:hypothetical protein